MKKSLIKWASLAALATLVPTNLLMVGDLASNHVQAATDLNFDQGSMNDEEYVRNILTQFNELDGYQSEMVDDETGSSTVTVYDKASGGTKVTSFIAASEFNEEMTMTYYIYDDGTNVSDELGYLDSSAIYMVEINPDYQAQVDEVRAQMGDALVLTPPAEGTESLATDNLFLAEEISFTEITKDGDVVKATIDAESYISDNPEMAELYPEGTQFSMVYTIDPAAGSVTSSLTIDVDEEALASESSDDELGVSIASLMVDTTVNVVMTATDEKVPAADELNTITQEEFQQLLTDVGLETY